MSAVLQRPSSLAAPRRALGMVVAFLALLATLAIAAPIAVPSAAAALWPPAGPNFLLPNGQCASEGLLFQRPDTQLNGGFIQRINMVSGEMDSQTYGIHINGVGYNVIDDYVYGNVNQGDSNLDGIPDTGDDVVQGLVRFHSDNTEEYLGLPDGWPSAQYKLRNNLGDISLSGQYITGGPDGIFFQVDLSNPGTPTFFDYVRMVDPTNKPEDNGFSANPDVAFLGNQMYRLYNDAVSGQAHLFRVNILAADPANVTYTDVFGGAPLTFNGAPWITFGGFGASYADRINNFMYVSNNGNGDIYRIDVDTGQVVLFTSTHFATSLNDGARCQNAPINVDFGDAPSNYGTWIGSNGPRHSVVPGLALGTAADAENDGLPNGDASGDDVTTSDDEDAYGPGPITLDSNAPVVALPITTSGTGGDPVTVAGWIDLNGNGVFDASERQMISVPAGTPLVNLGWGAANGASQNTFARFRIYQGIVADPQPVGPAGNGEVEDYPVVLTGSYHVSKSASVPSGTTMTPGQQIDYTITVTNDSSVALPASFSDPLGDVLDDATLVAGPSAGSIDGGNVLNWSGTVPAGVGATTTVTYSVVVNGSFGNAYLFNAVQGLGCPPGTTTPPCGHELFAGTYSVAKNADIPDGTTISPGQVINYRITVTPSGYSVPASFTDNLSNIVDDATLISGPTPSAGFASIDGSNVLSWSGPTIPNVPITVDYAFRVNNVLGDGFLENAVVGNGCAAGAATFPCRVEHYAGTYTVGKTSNPPSGTTLVPGQPVTYTITVNKTGLGGVTGATFSDELSAVLDDAFGPTNITASVGSAGMVDNTLQWMGNFGPGNATATITYTMTVKPAAQLNDGVITNGVTGPNCTATTPGCFTRHEIRAWTLAKSSNPAPGTQISPSSQVAYRLTLTNTGGIAIPDASLTDDLSDVLDDATITTGPTSGAAITGTTLNWAGALAVDQVVFIDYTVTADAYADFGDGTLFNAVVAPEAGCPAAVVTDPAAPGYNPNCSTYHYTPTVNVTKTSQKPNPIVPGSTVTYTITLTNTGTANVPSMTVTDDLTQVLDDAVFQGNPTANVGAASRNGNALTWTGPVAPGTPTVITYSVVVKAASAMGDGVLVNAALSRRTNCCPPVRDEIEAWTYGKTSNPGTGAVVTPGDTITYTITAVNTGGATLTKSIVDNMSDVLDDATLTAGPTANIGTATFSDPNDTITWNGTFAPDEVVTITYTVTVRPAYQLGNGSIGNVATGTGGECTLNCGGTHQDVRAWDVWKTANVVDVVPGGTVTYTIRVENTGNIPLTGLQWNDNLSGILDDAVVTTEPSATVGSVIRVNDVIAWTGDLAVDQIGTITYTVRVNKPLSGDRSLTNAVFTPDGDGPCNATNPIPDRCRADVPGKQLTIVKATEPADRITAVPGETVFYTLTITNTGDLAYPTPSGDVALIEDDLSGVLDDADGPTPAQITVTGPGAASFDANTGLLSWTGPIAVDQVVVVRYGITVHPVVTGDAHLLNVVASNTPGSLCPDPAVTDPEAPGYDPNCLKDTPISAYEIDKTSDPADGSEVEPGDQITYTVTLTNTGDVDLGDPDPLVVTDDLSGVLDDATLDGDPVASDGDAAITGDNLTWTGELPIGAVVTVTYTVTVNPSDEFGDAIIGNLVAGTGPTDCPDPPITDPQAPGYNPDCLTESKAKGYTIVKTADPVAGTPVVSGDEVTYTVTLTNTGEVDLTDLEVTDSLTDVLDDADVTTEPTADAGTVVRVGDVITWTGDLAIDEVVVVTYTVTVKPVLELGDGNLGNAVTGTGPVQCPDPPITDPNDPDFDPNCYVPLPVDAYTIVKSSDPADDAVVQPFDRITYTLTLTSVGQAPSVGLTVTDSLTDVLDDADLDGAPMASAGTVSVAGDVLTWTGDLAAAEVVTVTYVAVVKPPTALGDSHLGNVVIGTGNASCPPESEPDPNAPPDPDAEPVVPNEDCSTGHDVAAYTTLKEVLTPAPRPGEQATYRLTVTSVGSAPIVGETITDDLSGVLDDAVWANAASFTAGNPATAGAVSFTAPNLSWTGDIAVDDVLVITYSVILNPQITGDGWLRNLVVSNDCRLVAPSGSSPAFANAAMPPNCRTETPIPSVAFSKTVSPAGPFKPGDVVTYTITAANNGQVNLDGVNWTDDMTRVLDDADMVGQPSSDRGAASYSTPMVSWTGSLAVGEVAHITYQVTIRESRGDGSMPNGVVGVGPASNCPSVGAAIECQTLALVVPAVIPNDPSDPGELPRTGGNSSGILLVGSMLLAAGVGLVAVRRRRRSITS